MLQRDRCHKELFDRYEKSACDDKQIEQNVKAHVVGSYYLRTLMALRWRSAKRASRSQTLSNKTPSITIAMPLAVPQSRGHSPPPRARLRPPPSLLSSPTLSHRSLRSAHVLHPPPHRKAPSPESVFRIVFRVYPFPPTRTPLSYPLPSATATQNTANDANEDTVAVGPRKRLLRRWAGDYNRQGPKSVHLPSVMRTDIQGNHLHRSASAAECYYAVPQRFARKRQRSPLTDSLAVAEPTPTYDLMEGDPVLPLPQKPAHRMQKYTSYPMPYSADPGYTAFRTGKKPRLDDKLDMLPSEAKHTIFASRNGNWAQMNPPSATNGSLDDHIGCTERTRAESLLDRICHLQERRRSLEEAKLNEISTIAAALVPSKIPKEERLQLKEDMQRLSAKGVRDCLRLIARRLKTFQIGTQVEVKLHLDILPTDLIRELQLVVMHDRGQVRIRSAVQLTSLRAELKRAIHHQSSLPGG